MKKIFFTVLLLILSVFVITSCGNNADSSDNNEAADKNTVFGIFNATDIYGNEVNESVFAENKLTMVNIWATFCGPCINEMPYLAEIADDYADEGLAVIGVVADVSDEKGNVSDYLLSNAVYIVDITGADYLHIVPSAEMFSAKLDRTNTFPETIFIDSEGNQVGESYIGARSEEQWIEIIDSILSQEQSSEAQ